MPRGGKRLGAGRRAGVPNKKTAKVRERIAKHLELTADATIEQIRRGSQYDVRALFDDRGNLRPLSQLTAEEAMPIAGFEIVKRNLAAGDGQVDTVIKVKLIDRSRYVEMAAKHHGLLTEKVEHSGGIAITHELPE